VSKISTVDFETDQLNESIAVSFEKRSWEAALRLLPTLKDVRQNLALEFAHVPLTDDDLAMLQGWTNLTAVTIRGCDVTDAGVCGLATLPQLRTLSLSGSKLSAASLDGFAYQQTLKAVLLTGHNFTDECVPKLARLRGVTSLWLENHKLTAEGVA